MPFLNKAKYLGGSGGAGTCIGGGAIFGGGGMFGNPGWPIGGFGM